MEQLVQKYTKYFYATLIGIIIIQVIDIIIKAIQGCAECNTFILVFLSILNVPLLISSLVHNIRQQFTECKINAKILRLTIAVLIGFQTISCFQKDYNLISLGNNLMTLVVIEIVLNYRIKSIEYLEKKACKLLKNTTPK